MFLRGYQRVHSARKRIANLFQCPDRVFAIHYACESFYSSPQGGSPRVAAIAVCNLYSRSSFSFSIDRTAERLGIHLDDIPCHYPLIEKQMLHDCFQFVSTKSGVTWLHWNMRDSYFGFQALEHRFRVFGGKPHHIPETSKVDLSLTLTEIYGDSYIADPKLEQIATRNSLSMQDFLSGQAEAAAFEKYNLNDINRSALRKVEIICQLAQKAADGQLKINTPWHNTFATSIILSVLDHPVYYVLTILATFASILSLAPTLVSLLP